MIMRRILLLVFIMGLAVLSCSHSVTVPQIDKPVTDADLIKPIKAYNKVLKNFVDNQGRVDFLRLDKNRSDLETFVRFLGKISPDSNPEKFFKPEEQTAYLINAYNGLFLYGLLEYGAAKNKKALEDFRFSGFTRLRFLSFRKFKFGGKSITLSNFEDELLRPLNDPRIYFAINVFTKSGPKIKQSAYSGANLIKSLNAGAKSFLDEPKNAFFDQEARTVYLSEVLDRHEEQFLKKAGSLVAYANQFKTEKLPEDESLSLDFLDFDASLKSQPIAER